MIYLVPDTEPDRLRLIFQFPHAREVKSVAVMGTFNNYKSLTPLAQRMSNGPWEGTVTVARNSEHWFYYMVNGSDQRVDPHLPVKQTSSGANSYFTAVLVPLKSSGDGTTSNETHNIQADYHILTSMVAGALNQPKKRISLASKMHALAQQSALDPASRFDLLQQSVLLDPFNTHIRLALGQLEQQLGMHEEAVASYKQVLEMRPNDRRVNLLLAEALIPSGQLDAASESLKKVPSDVKLGRRAAYDQIEIDLRKAGQDDAKKILSKLSDLNARTGEEGIFCEKCLKLLSEWDAPEIIEQIMKMVHTQYADSRHPAIVALKQVASYPLPESINSVNEVSQLLKNLHPDAPFKPTIAHALVSTLCAQRVARAFPVDGAENQVKSLADWRRVDASLSKNWHELRSAYLLQISDWAIKAYKKKAFDLAATLWGEAGRISPHNPAILQNLAIVNTRLGEDASQAHYWQQLTQTWTAYSDLLPEAEGYTKHLIQKHQVFVEGAENKLTSLQTPAELLELGEQWIKEAIPLLALRQLAFRNPLFRCGVMSDDYVGKEERDELLKEGFLSTLAMLRVSHDWLGLNDISPLAQKRLLRLDQAYQDAKNDQNGYRYYEEEKQSFKLHREMVVKQYLMLLFRILLPLAEKMDINDKLARDRYAVIARGLLTFPHRILKPGVLKTVEQLDADTNMQQMVMNYAVGPWFKRAQDLLQNKQAEKAAPLFEEALQVAPDFTLCMFYLAQCRIEQKRWNEIEPLLREARQKCKDGDELIEPIDNLLDQLPMIKIGEEFHQAQEFMQEEDWKHALDNLQYADQISPNQVPVLFYTAVCHFRMDHWDDAETVARRTLKLCTQESHKDAKEQLEILIKQLPMARMAKSIEKVRQFMDKEQWGEAIKVLDQVLAADKSMLVAQFYKAVCHFRREEWDKAESTALEAKRLTTDDDQEIYGQIELILNQIPLARRAAAMKPITDALEKQQWSTGVAAADHFLAQYHNHPVALFYKAVCQLRNGQNSDAKTTAETAMTYAKGSEYSDLRNQLTDLLKASNQAAWAGEMNKAVAEMNNENWLDAWSHLGKVISQNSSNAQAHYYQALCWFKFSMEPLQKYGKKIQSDERHHYISAMETVIESLDKAEKNSSWSDRDLRKGINNLREAASNVLKQLRGY